jgi:hypothetical protein
MKWKLILRWVSYNSLAVVFLRQNWIILQISSNLSLSLSLSLYIYIYIYIYATDMIRHRNMMKYNLFFLRWRGPEKQEDERCKHWKIQGTLKKMKIIEGYDLVSEPSIDTNLCEPRDHVVTQPKIKIEMWSQKAEIGLIGVWHNENLPQDTNTIGMK